MSYHCLPASLRMALFTAAAIILAFGIAACGRSAKSAQASTAPEVHVAKVVNKSVHQWDEFTGRVAATDAVNVLSRVSGYVERIAFKEGDEVKQGDLLFVIDPRPYKTVLDNSIAQLERARASAKLALAQNHRAEALIRYNAVSRDYYDVSNTTLAQANADMHAAEASMASAKLNFDFTEVRSPIAGRVSRAMLTVGNLAQADQSVLTSVVSQDPIYIYFQLDEQTFLRYSELARKGERQSSGNAVRIGLASDAGFPYAGTVNFVNNQIDPATGTISLRAVVANPGRVFTPGLFARVQIESSADARAILIDDKAIMTDQDRKYVYVMGPENKAMRKDITLGGLAEGMRIVQSGLNANDAIIVSGLQKVTPNSQVKPHFVAMRVAATIDVTATMPVATK